MKLNQTPTLRARTALVGGAAALALVLSACGSDSSDDATGSSSADASAGAPDAADAAALSVTDPWVKATDDDMTAMFGTIVNDTDADITVVGATSDVAGTVELHEVVAGDGGAMLMQPKEGGFTVPAGGTHALEAGGDHVMLMDLTGPLEAGQDVTVTLELADGSTQDVTAVVKPFTGADEEYAGGMDMDHEDMDHGDHEDMDHGDHDHSEDQ
ncbi:copper(I)-binding protein [Nocardioides zeae]|uniref:Copper(I)-binding protein n=1 Tax=Nocardioides zeae TaxID=1457234 RepID=A0ACC6IDM8_9ACTN|nr:copper chaperone PCu(A)C [Nocardioides zeae]MDR6174056.1 copper(I)-binding protein [Nocardioides zeae]MDR6208863.1 copper(I)-binding protein [Nocardioides zeae]